MATGILLTAPKGSKYWHPCQDPEVGLAEMKRKAFTYGAAWGHPETSIVFGDEDGVTFTPTKVLKKAVKPAPEPPIYGSPDPPNDPPNGPNGPPDVPPGQHPDGPPGQQPDERPPAEEPPTTYPPDEGGKP